MQEEAERLVGVSLSRGDEFDLTYEDGSTESWVLVEERRGTVRYCEPDVWENHDLDKVGATLESATEFNKRLDSATKVVVRRE